MHNAPMFEIGNEIDFVLSEAKRLRLRYPGIKVVPMLYRVEASLLSFIGENDPAILCPNVIYVECEATATLFSRTQP